MCKYVRRELRTLFEEDRKEVLSALKQIHSLSSEAGTTKFGTPFYNYVTLTAMHNSNTYCYHDGLQFLTSHPMFSLMVEKTMQNINPKLTLPYWDFLVEGKEYGADFYKSFVYGNDYFGSVDNGAADSYTMRSGSYFTGIPHAWDADGDISGTNHNAHGGVFDGYNENANQTLKRSNEFCGLANTQTWPVPDDLFNCMVNASWLYGWDECMENNIHANFHGWHGGAWDCAVDFSTEYLDDKWDGQLDKGQLGFLGPMARAAWYQYAPSNNWTHCPRTFACNSATHTGGCKCSSKLDVDKMTDEEVDGWAQPFIDEVLNGQYQYDKWLEADSKGVWWWKNMDTERSYLFNRLMLKWGSSPGFAGAMGGGPASNDPIFWVIHPLFEGRARVAAERRALGRQVQGLDRQRRVPRHGLEPQRHDAVPRPLHGHRRQVQQPAALGEAGPEQERYAPLHLRPVRHVGRRDVQPVHRPAVRTRTPDACVGREAARSGRGLGDGGVFAIKVARHGAAQDRYKHLSTRDAAVRGNSAPTGHSSPAPLSCPSARRAWRCGSKNEAVPEAVVEMRVHPTHRGHLQAEVGVVLDGAAAPAAV